jgi:hypothetical protein
MIVRNPPRIFNMTSLTLLSVAKLANAAITSIAVLLLCGTPNSHPNAPPSKPLLPLENLSTLR